MLIKFVSKHSSCPYNGSFDCPRDQVSYFASFKLMKILLYWITQYVSFNAFFMFLGLMDDMNVEYSTRFLYLDLVWILESRVEMRLSDGCEN